MVKQTGRDGQDDTAIRQAVLTQLLQSINLRSASDHFTQALAENSNLEMDWLWAAAHVKSGPEKEYCYHKALFINPESEPAARGLKALAANRLASTTWRGDQSMIAEQSGLVQ